MLKQKLWWVEYDIHSSKTKHTRWTRRAKKNDTNIHVSFENSCTHKKDSIRRMKKIERQRKNNIRGSTKTEWKKIRQTLFVICERFFEWQLCASEKEWAVSTQRDTIRHFVALVFIATMKKAHTLTEWASEWAKRKSVITFFFSPQLNARVYCDSLIPFLRGANTQQAHKKKKKQQIVHKKSIHTDLMVRVRALVQWFCLLFLGISAVDVLYTIHVWYIEYYRAHEWKWTRMRG